MPRSLACLPAFAYTFVALVLSAEEPKVYLVAPTEPLTAAEQLKTFHLPAGYEIQLVASEPEIRKPINLNFDASGRMYVTQSIEYPFPAKEGTKPRDTIRLLTDTNGDGLPDKVSIFADGLNIPIGVTPLHDGVLCYSIPKIEHFRDTDGDGQADVRTPYYEVFGFRDTHGMASSFNWWIDGWVYACHGFSNDSTVKGKDGQEIKMHSGNTFRLKPDGSHVEQHTWGQVNPFGLTFDDLGNLYSADCHSKPIYNLLRRAYYPSFGKPDDGLGYGPEMIAHSHNSTGICGVAYFGSNTFAAGDRQTVFLCNPVTGRINHDRLGPHGSTYQAVEMPDFVTCDDPWFRPVDVKLGPDGALYIADFYNRIIGHYEVPLTHPQRDRERGRIWRVVYKGEGAAPHTAPPDLAKAPASQLVETLGHPNILLRTQAVQQLVHRVGPPAVEALKPIFADPSKSNNFQRGFGLWVLERLGALDNALIKQLAKDEQQLVRTHLARALAERPKWSDDVQQVALSLADDRDPQVRRAAADALGRHPQDVNISALLDIWREADRADTHLIHVARIALRDNLAALGDVEPALKNIVLRSGDTARLGEVCMGIRTASAANYVLQLLGRGHLSNTADRIPGYVHHIVRYVDADKISEAVRQIRLWQNDSDQTWKVSILRSVYRGLGERGAEIPVEIRGWAQDEAMKLLWSDTEGSLRTGLDVTREMRLTAFSDRVAGLAMQSKFPALRQPAVECLLVLDSPRALGFVQQLVEDGQAEIAARQKAADQLGGINNEASRKALMGSLAIVPAPVQVSIARALSGSKEGADALLQSVEQGKASARLLQDQIVSEKLKAANPDKQAERVAALVKDLPPEEDRQLALINARRDAFLKTPGKPEPGLAIFTKTCAGCHRLEGKGAKVGPDLDGIGLRGLERLLEDTLNPNRNVDQAFRSTVLELKDGKTLTGLLLREEGEILVVVNDQSKEVRIPKGDVEAQRQLRLSPMPANIAEQLPPDDFNNLMAYLLSQRGKPAPPQK